MSTHDEEPDEMLLGRLREATSGDAALRRLRRRYDQLREDYEILLDRLGELEERLAEHESDVANARTTTPNVNDPIDGAPASLAQVIPHLIAPLTRLREEYEATLGGLQTIVDGLNTLAAGAMKGQHSPEGETVPEPVREPGTGRPRQLQVEVKGKGFGELLDFQERISSIDGVARVSIHGIDSERATFIVELTD